MALQEDLDDLLFRYLELREESRRDAQELLERVEESSPDTGSALKRAIARLEESGLVEPEEFSGLMIGPFIVRRRIARGGMGEVYLADPRDGGPAVALKVLRRELEDDDASRARFAREVKAVERLRHPGIAALVDHGESDGLPYLAFELIEGTTLATAIRTSHETGQAALRASDFAHSMDGVDDANGLFQGSWHDAVARIGRDIAGALAHAHARGVVHRDVKPSNVMITPAGRVVLLDFGLATLDAADRLTRDRARVGSLPYMAPEVVREGHDGDMERAALGDVYSLGVTLYELAVRKLPFASIEADRLAIEILAGPDRTIRGHAPDAPVDLERCIACAMARDPKRRYPTAAAMGADLDEHIAGRAVRAESPRFRDSVATWARRNPARATAAVAASLVAVVAPLSFAAVERAHAKETEGLNGQLATALSDATGNAEVALTAIERLLRRVAEIELDNLPGGTDVRREMLEDAFEILDDLPTEGELGLRADISRSMLLHSRGDLSRMAGDREAALPDYEETEEILRRLLRTPEYAGSHKLRYELASVLAQSGGLHADLDLNDEAVALYDRGIELMREVHEAGWTGGDVEVSIGQALADRAKSHRFLEDHDAAEQDALDALEWLKPVDGWRPIPASLAASDAYKELYSLERARSDLKSAIEHARAARASAEEVIERQPYHRTARRAAADADFDVAVASMLNRQLDDSEEALVAAEQGYESLARDYPGWSDTQVIKLEVIGMRAQIAAARRDPQKAFDLARRCVEEWRHGPEGPNVTAGLVTALSNLSNLIVHIGEDDPDELQEARAAIEEAIRLADNREADDTLIVLGPEAPWTLRYNAAVVNARLGRMDAARDALADAARVAGPAATDQSRCARFLADGQTEIWLALERTGAPEEECTTAREATIAALERAVDAGYSDHRELSSSPYLKGLRDDPRFVRLLERID